MAPPPYGKKFASASRLLAKGYTIEALDERSGNLKADKPAPKRQKTGSASKAPRALQPMVDSLDEAEAEDEAEDEADQEVEGIQAQNGGSGDEFGPFEPEAEEAGAGETAESAEIPTPARARSGRQVRRPAKYSD